MNSITVFPIDQTEAAFRFMQSGNHIGKIVVHISDGVRVRVASKVDGVLLRDDDAAYIIAGGTGGQSREICKWVHSVAVTKWTRE